MPSEHFINVTKTARYFTLGSLGERTRLIWIVLHGYAQLAREFILPFSILDPVSNFIVAPEGLNRFYAKGFAGRPAATWMTSEDREHEIKDYTAYLERLYEELGFQNFPEAKIILLGFSQGAATASRWLHATRFPTSCFVIYSGAIGQELADPFSSKISAVPLMYVTGKADPLISKPEHEKVYELMKSVHAELLEFEGGHEVLPEVIGNIEKRLLELVIKT